MNLSRHMGRCLAALQLRRMPLFTVDIPTALSRGGRALACIPEDPEAAAAALEAVDRLAEWFDPIDVILLSAKAEVSELPATGHSVLAVPAAVNQLGLPYRQVVQRVKGFAPAAAIDLSPRFSLATAYLCVVSGASLRIGMHGPQNGFFNLQYTWSKADDSPLDRHYGRFLDLLESLRASAGS